MHKNYTTFNCLYNVMHLPVKPSPQLCTDVSPGAVLPHVIPNPISTSCRQAERYVWITQLRYWSKTAYLYTQFVYFPVYEFLYVASVCVQL